MLDYVLYKPPPKGAMRRVSFRLRLTDPEEALSDHQLLLAELQLEPARAPTSRRGAAKR